MNVLEFSISAVDNFANFFLRIVKDQLSNLVVACVLAIAFYQVMINTTSLLVYSFAGFLVWRIFSNGHLSKLVKIYFSIANNIGYNKSSPLLYYIKQLKN
jgi:hypothetical protein